MPDIVLVQPEYETLGNFSISSNPPLGLGYMGAVLTENHFDFKILDLTLKHSPKKQYIEEIIRLNPKILGISVNTPSLPIVYEMIKRLKISGFKGFLVLGGPHITARPNSIIALGAQYGIAGEGDYSLNMLCRFLIRNEGGLEYIPNLVINRGSGVIMNKKEIVEKLDELPFPIRKISSTDDYGFMHVMCSRGCPFKCIYCSMAKTKHRKRSVERIVDELEFLIKEYPNTSFGFSDDVFTIDENLVQGLCDEIMERRLRLGWSCTTRVDLVDEKMLKMMHAAGCWHISFGIESGVQEIRYAIGKEIVDEDFRSKFEMCRKIGLKTRAYAMFGHPNESKKDMYKTINFIKELKPDDVVFSLTSIYPGTTLAKKAILEGAISENIWEDNMIKGLGAPVYTPNNLTLEDMKDVLYDGFNRFYLTPGNIIKGIGRSRSIEELGWWITSFYNYIHHKTSI